jgi:phosphatidate cytidylyltransferase
MKSSMAKKVSTGLVLGGGMLTVMILDPQKRIPLLIVALLGTGMGLWEYYTMLQKKNVKPLIFLGIGVGLLFVLLAYKSMLQGSMLRAGATFGTVITFFVFLVLVIQFFQIVNRRERYSILDLATTVFGSIYIGGFMSMVFLLLGFGMKKFPDNNALVFLVIFLPMWCAWGSDVCAYFVGSFIGRTRIFPELSPKKTLEGCLGGLLGAMVGVTIICSFIKIPVYHGILLGFVGGAAAQIGDLSESAFKREVGVKDSGRTFGSHGGFLDRSDSFLFALPVIYHYFIWFCPWVK